MNLNEYLRADKQLAEARREVTRLETLQEQHELDLAALGVSPKDLKKEIEKRGKELRKERRAIDRLVRDIETEVSRRANVETDNT